MEQQTREMMSQRVQAKEFAIRHVGQPGQWMPVRCVNTCEGPSNVGQAQTFLNVAVCSDIEIVIIIDEFVVDRRQESPDDQTEQKSTNDDYPLSMQKMGRRDCHRAFP